MNKENKKTVGKPVLVDIPDRLSGWGRGEMVYTPVSKTDASRQACGFESHRPHQLFKEQENRML